MDPAIVDVFALGINFATHLERLPVHAARVEEVYDRLAFVPEEELGRSPLGSSRVLILTEPFCIDAVFNVPLIARLAEASPESTLRIASRDAHPALARAFPGRDGRSRVPTVIFLDSTGGAQGYWSERSARDHQWMAEFLADDPIPPITLEDGRPTAVLGDWMTRRFEAQLPIFLSDSWRCVRGELARIASAGLEAAKRERVEAAE